MKNTELRELIREQIFEELTEELCAKGKAYVKRRKAAGEKHGAYLMGRAVKVCKGQMSGKKKKKKKNETINEAKSDTSNVKDIILKTLEKEGGAAGLKALKKSVKKADISTKDLEKDLDKMSGVKQHKDGDYISTPINEEEIARLQKLANIQEEKITEAKYKGKTVTLNKPMRGDSKKFKVYVNSGKKNADGSIKVKKVEFGAKGMKIRKNNPKARAAFRARHRCDNPGPKPMARYWSCKKW